MSRGGFGMKYFLGYFDFKVVPLQYRGGLLQVHVTDVRNLDGHHLDLDLVKNGNVMNYLGRWQDLKACGQ